MIIFTAGSYLTETGGHEAIAIEDKTDSKYFGPINGISNYKLEVMALVLALNHYIDLNEMENVPKTQILPSSAIVKPH